MAIGRTGIKRLWRPFIGIVVAYAVAAQSLLLVLGAFALPAAADSALAGFELCHQDAQAAPELPTGNPDHLACTHCILCFAGAHQAVIAGAPAASYRAYADVPVVARAIDGRVRPKARAHLIAAPRGPPRNV